MSESVLHTNHNHPIPYFRVIAFVFFYTWNMVYFKLQINGSYLIVLIKPIKHNY